MLKPFALLIAIGLGTVATGADKPVAPAIPTYEAFAKTIRSYPYQVAAVRGDQIRKGAPKLARCLSKEQALKLLGQPDYESNLRDPQNPGKAGIASSWTYYLVRKTPQDDESDAKIVLWFNTKDRIEAMFLRGVQKPEPAGKYDHLKKCG